MKVDAHFCGASLQKVAQAERGSMQLLAEFGEHVIAGAIVVEGYAVSEGSGGELELSRSRATLARDYIHARFQLDSQNIGTVPLRGVPPPSTQKNSWNGICIVLLSLA